MQEHSVPKQKSFLKGYTVGPVDVKPGLVLSPMSGVTTRPFRRLIKELNPGAVGLLVSEFVSVEGMTRGSKRTLEMMRFAAEERPYCVQIFGYDVDRMREAALMVQDIGADVVDINCGCPAPKVVKRGGGCELMRQPEHLAQIIRAVTRAVSIPVTIKIRAGWDDSSRNALEIARMAEREGVQALAVHGRTRAQLYRGDADWNVVAEIADALTIPVLGSGDVVDPASASERLRGKIAGLFIGRASMWNPFVFGELVSGQCRTGRIPHDTMLQALFRYIELLREDFADASCAGKLKQLASQLCRGAPWRKELLVLNTLDAQIELLQRVRDGAWQGSTVPQGTGSTVPQGIEELSEASCDQFASV